MAVTEARIDAISPGLFTANANGHGAAAAVAVKVSPDGTRTSQLIFLCGAAPGSCVPAPIDLGGPGDQVVLTLFGTGIRGRSSLGAIRAAIIGSTLEVLYAGPQGDFVGLDQVNVRLLPNPFVRDEQELRLYVDGRPANPVTIRFQ